MWFFKSLICILLQLCLLFQNIYCNEKNVDNDIILSTNDLQNIHSFFYMSEKPDAKTKTKTSDQSYTVAQQCNCKEWNERNNQEVIFYKRMVAILLSNLAMQKIDDRLMGIISIEAASSQFEYLQNFVNGQGSIKEVDRILSNIIKPSGLSTYQTMAEISYYFNVLLETLTDWASFISKRWDITIISFLVIINFMVLRRHRFSRGLVIFLIIDVILAISFFITWWRLIQEAEIKLMAAQTQFAEMPISCKPHKMSLLDKMMASFSSTNDCEKYYESIMTDPRLQVTPAFVLTHLLSTTVLQPFSHFGIVISEFIDNATNKLGFFYKYPVVIILFMSFCVCIIFIPFFLFGGSLNLGFGFFKFGLRGKSNEYDRIERIYENISSKKRLKHSEKMKQIMLRQNEDDMDIDSAGGDAITDAHVLSPKCEKCKCKNIDKNEDESIKHEKKEEGDGDC